MRETWNCSELPSSKRVWACSTGIAATVWLGVQIWTAVLVFEGDLFARMRAATDLRGAVPAAASPPCDALPYFALAGFNIAAWVVGWLGFVSLCCCACCVAGGGSGDGGGDGIMEQLLSALANDAAAAASSSAPPAPGVPYPYSHTGGYTLANTFGGRMVQRLGSGGGAVGAPAPVLATAVPASLPPYAVTSATAAPVRAGPAEPAEFGDTERMGGVPGSGGSGGGGAGWTSVTVDHPKSR